MPNNLPNKPIRLTRSKPIVRMDRMFDRCLRVVEKEIEHIEASSRYKLDAHVAKDLREYVKLVADMKEVQLEREAERKRRAEAKAKHQSEEELEKLVKDS